MKTLYVSDLDGTLLRSDETTSEYTNQTLNRLTEQGMLFSYATARSLVTAKKVTKGLKAKIPLIVYNGAFVMDNVTGERLISHFFDEDVYDILDEMIAHDVYPIVYSFTEEKEKFTYIPNLISKAEMDFIATRKGDVRANPKEEIKDLYAGDIFYITCIDEEEKLATLHEKYKDRYHCVYQRDIYSGEQWLEIMPLHTSKANAIKQLKEYLGCDKLVVFGDGKNDIDMFELADECYAVENAVEELKLIATAIIGDNNKDSVAKWLEKNINKIDEKFSEICYDK